MKKRSTKFFSKLYYSLVNWLTIVKMPPQGADVFLIDKVVINAFKKIPEKHSSVFMLLSWLGFKQTSVSFVKRERLYGKSKWSLSRKIKLVVDSVLSFSDVPIRYSSIIGIITALIGFIYATFITYTYIFNNRSVEGWTIVLIAILIIAGIQMSILGILGEYLWRTFDESRHRPQYIIEKTVNITNN